MEPHHNQPQGQLGQVSVFDRFCQTFALTRKIIPQLRRKCAMRSENSAKLTNVFQSCNKSAHR